MLLSASASDVAGNIHSFSTLSPMRLLTQSVTHLHKISVALSCFLLVLTSACSLAPEPQQLASPRSQTKNQVNCCGTWNDLFFFLSGDYPNQADQPWHTAPSWMYGQGGANPKPKAVDMPGDYQIPDKNSVLWKGASIYAPLPGEDDGPGAAPNLISFFNYGLDNNLYIYALSVYLDSDLPRTSNGDYREFNLIKVEPVTGSSPYFKFSITYEVRVLGTGPGGPLIEVEPRKTVLATYDFSANSGHY